MIQKDRQWAGWPKGAFQRDGFGRNAGKASLGPERHLYSLGN